MPTALVIEAKVKNKLLHVPNSLSPAIISIPSYNDESLTLVSAAMVATQSDDIHKSLAGFVYCPSQNMVSEN